MRSSCDRGLALLLLVGACNRVLGLDEPERVSSIADADGDGVADSRDNCPLTANPGQQDADQDRRGDACDQCPLAAPTRDRDQDGVDDACDLCLLGPDVDDDGDGVMDACDLCPAAATTAQNDEDGDIIGDECDGPANLGRDNERIAFYDLTSIDPAWVQSVPWTVQADSSSVSPTGTELATMTWSEAAFVTSISVAFEVADDGVVGIAFGYPTIACTFECTAGTCRLHLQGPALDAFGEPSAVRRGGLHVTHRPPGMLELDTFACILIGDDGAEPLSFDTTAREVQPSVVATPGSRILGVDLVD